MKIPRPRIHILIVLFAFCALSSCKREVTENRNTFGTILGQGGNFELNEVLKTKDGNYILCGHVVNGSNGLCDGFVMKVDEKFSVLWYREYGGYRDDYFSSMAMDDEGNILLAGTSFSYGVSIDTANPFPKPLFFNLMTDNDGNRLWQNTLEAHPGGVNLNNNRVFKVLYHKSNHSFIVSAEANNWSSGLNDSISAFCYTVNKQGSIVWSRRLYSKNKSYEMNRGIHLKNAVFSADGNILLLAVGHNVISSYPFFSMVLIKTPATGNGYSTNIISNQGSPFIGYWLRLDKLNTDLLYETYAVESVGGDNLVAADWTNYGIVFLYNMGAIRKPIHFKRDLVATDIRREADKLIITGTNPNCFITTDLAGNVLEEIYPDEKELKQVTFVKHFVNSSGERIVFGTTYDKISNKIIALRYGLDGKLLK